MPHVFPFLSVGHYSEFTVQLQPTHQDCLYSTGHHLHLRHGQATRMHTRYDMRVLVLSAIPKDDAHPFGHPRIERITPGWIYIGQTIYNEISDIVLTRGTTSPVVRVVVTGSGRDMRKIVTPGGKQPRYNTLERHLLDCLLQVMPAPHPPVADPRFLISVETFDPPGYAAPLTVGQSSKTGT